jgi:hypothetical protein
MNNVIYPFARQGHFTMIDDAVIDIIMPQLSCNAVKILILIIRKTVGWKKEEDFISYTQIMKGTGIGSEHTVSRGINELVKIGVVLVKKYDDKKTPNKYSLNRSFELDDKGGTAKSAVGGTAKSAETKDTTTKDNLSGKEPTPRKESDFDRIKRELFDYFVEIAFEKNGAGGYFGLTDSESARNKLFYQQLLKLYLYYQKPNTNIDGKTTKRKYNFNPKAIESCKRVLAEAVKRHREPCKKAPNGLSIVGVNSIEYVLGEILREEKAGGIAPFEEVKQAVRTYGLTKTREALADLSPAAMDIVETIGNWRNVCMLREGEMERKYYAARRNEK